MYKPGTQSISGIIMLNSKCFAIIIIEDKKLDIWTHNKAITKAIESYRITDDKKEYLRTLKIKIDNKN